MNKSDNLESFYCYATEDSITQSGEEKTQIRTKSSFSFIQKDEA